MAYRSLKSFFHQHNEAKAREVLAQRRSCDTTLHWNFPVGREGLFVVLTPELLAATEAIWQQDARLNQLWSRIPLAARQGLLRDLVISEVQATNAIEGVVITSCELDSMLRLAQQKHAWGCERFSKMLQYYYELAQGQLRLPKNPQELRNMYDSFFAGEISPEDMPDGLLFRAEPVIISDGLCLSGHQGFTPEAAIIAGIETVLQVMNAEVKPRLVYLVMAHYMFESVHPFYDGNGRLGRFLLTQGLATVLSPLSALGLSAAICQEKSKYYKAFTEVQHKLNYGDGTPFAFMILDAVLRGQKLMSEKLA